MDIEFSGNTIRMDRELSNLDNLVIKFTKILEETNTDYVIVSGYIAILFGRSRNTEDVDIFIEEIPYEKFVILWDALKSEGFECFITSDPKEAYSEYLKNQLALRFAVTGTRIPNFEVKFTKTELNEYSLRNPIKVLVGNNHINTSKLELQIAFKLYLGSDKDIEDARHLWNIFKDNIDKDLVLNFAKRLKVIERMNELEQT